MNELPAVGPENLAYARRFGAQSPLIQTMASDMFPVSFVDFGQMDPELLALGTRMRAAVFSGANAVAARFSAVGLANPINSGVIAVLEGVDAQVGAAQTIAVYRQGLAVSALQSSTLGWPMDSRQSERASVRAIATDEAAAANYGDNVQRFLLLNATQFHVLPVPPYVLAPSSTLWFVGLTANTALNVNFRWRQRRIEDGEVSPV